MNALGTEIFDPKKAECVGFYLYGSGYYSGEDQQMAIVRAQHAVSFCNECPLIERCKGQQERRVREADPEAVEEFDRGRREAARRGIGEHLYAAALMKGGRPDPFLRDALKSHRQGMADRKRAAVR